MKHLHYTWRKIQEYLLDSHNFVNCLGFWKIPGNFCLYQFHENFRLLLIALNTKKKDVSTKFQTFIEKVVCSTESKNCMMQDCTLCSEKRDVFSVTGCAQDCNNIDDGIKFYQ